MTRWIQATKDPWSAATHLFGLVAAMAGFLLLVGHSSHDVVKQSGMAIYGASLIAVFLSSTVYHAFDIGHKGNQWLRRVDHVGIFLLIGGSYVPTLLHLLDGTWRLTMLSLVGAIAFIGITFRVAWIDCPPWLGVGIYLLFGWISLVPAGIILPQLSVAATSLLLGGAAAYTLGAFVFFRERPDPWPDVFGHHEVWHLFVLAGATAHFAYTWLLLDIPIPPFG
jgi:hemolysin III